jgi:uracil-DNA glycosylase
MVVRAKVARTEPARVQSEPLAAATSLEQLRLAEARCRRCPLYQDATQVVPGEGKRKARIMLVGEQPGDQEDLAGRPFVGPAGRILDRALADAGINRRDLFVTNAVKHFKHTMRGKRRLHKRPSVYEIERCKWWLDQERLILRPEVIVALGATAARGVLGKTVTIAAVRGKPMTVSDGEQAIVTVHPSSLLRIDDDTDRKAAYQHFVRDLREASNLLAR